jgi:hypothetical protein
MRIMVKAIFVLFFLQLSVYGFCREKMELDSGTGMWTYKGGIMTPLDSTLENSRDNSALPQENVPPFLYGTIAIPNEAFQYNRENDAFSQQASDKMVVNDSASEDKNTNNHNQSQEDNDE